MIKPNISQSLIKAYLDYSAPDSKECGIAFRKRYFEKIKTEPTDVQKLGIYFEYMATGYHHMSEPTPQPEYVYKNTAKERLSAEYERANLSAQFYKAILKKHNIEVISNGQYFIHDEVSMITDVIANWNGEKCIIDLKYTSLFDDRFNEYGWNTDTLSERHKLTLQPIHYKYLFRKIEGIEDIPFYFFIFSAKDPEKVKIIKVNVQEVQLHFHEHETIKKTKNNINHYYNNPQNLLPRPSYLKCIECPFADDCEYRAIVPLIEEIHI
jgi:hypothetical protein